MKCQRAKQLERKKQNCCLQEIEESYATNNMQKTYTKRQNSQQQPRDF